MRPVWYILSTLLTFTSTVAFSDDIPKYVLEKAASAHISEVLVTTVKIKSITKDGDKIILEFGGFAEIGSQKTQRMEQQETFFEPRKEGEVRLIDLAEDSKEIRIYWGYNAMNWSKVLAFEKIR